ncbi:MAG: DNA/RNA non-specific endonuclease [Anaerolineae bacterium]|nr:DNA/RNA non-specific endonuclease [Gloeobacterales cyanobacterium ES-bin-313]
MKSRSSFIGASAALLTTFTLMLGSPSPANAETSVHLLLGNPSGATTHASNRSNYLLVKPQYALSYSDYTKIPNWVSWQLNQSWLGSADSQYPDSLDSTLPLGWQQIPADNCYSCSGFDRGHMTPAADRSNTAESNSATFVMTNIIPMAPENAQGPWRDLEEYCRELVAQGKELYIISGGHGTGKTMSSTLLGQSINVPAKTWKVILVLDRPDSGLEGVNAETRVIAVDIPNESGVRNNDWRSYRVTVDSIEAATGLNFLSNVSPSVERTLEARVDNQ